MLKNGSLLLFWLLSDSAIRHTVFLLFTLLSNPAHICVCLCVDIAIYALISTMAMPAHSTYCMRNVFKKSLSSRIWTTTYVRIRVLVSSAHFIQSLQQNPMNEKKLLCWQTKQTTNIHTYGII